MTLASTPQYDSQQISESGDHAVVVGGSMAGLLAARVLDDAFTTVTVVEKDPLPDEPVDRAGTPQANHGHAMQEAGRATLEALFPGYTEELTAAGGVEIDLLGDFKQYDHGGFMAEGSNRIPWYCASRPLFEQITRRRVVELDDVTVRDGCQVREYLVDEQGSAVEGVRIRDENAEPEELSAGLVVDATGRTSRTPDWLADHGYSAPPVDEVDIDLAYSTIEIARPSDDQRGYFVPPSPPRKRGLGMFPIEDGRWLLTLAGVHGDHPPTDRDELAEFAASFPVPLFERLIDEQEILSEVSHYPFPSSRRRRYWELERFPDGLVVIGDAITSFNPVYGQGMSVAALEALHLHHALAEDPENDLALRFFDSIETVVDDAWSMAVGADFRFSETTGPKPPGTGLMNRYFARLTRKAHTDEELAETVARVQLMERRPSEILRPRVVWRVLKPTLRGPGILPFGR